MILNNMENIKETLSKILQEDTDPETINRVMDMFILQREDVIRGVLAEIDEEIRAVQSHPEMYAQQMRILSLQDARKRVYKMLEIKKYEI